MFTSIIGWFISGIIAGLFLGFTKEDSESKAFGYGVALNNAIGIV